jgi:Flp pilus assembly pilin Flp
MVQYMLVLISSVMRDRKGVSSLEYAILAFGIIGAVTLALQSFGTGLSGIFADIINDLQTHPSAS